MGALDVPPRGRRAWALAQSHHDVIERAELLELGFTPKGIRHRLAKGPLYPTDYDGIYAAGRPKLTRRGNWYAAARACGDLAGLSHGSGAAYWEIGRERGVIEISVPHHRPRAHRGLRVHRRSDSVRELFVVDGCMPVTSPALTIIDLASYLERDDDLHAAMSEADAKGLVEPKALRDFAAARARIPGAARVRDLLDRLTFRMPRSVLERKFLPLADRAGLGELRTQAPRSGYRVDFYDEELRLVIETDGNTFHRSPQKQARDNRRDRDHVINGYTPLRFSHDEIAHQPERVVTELRLVVARLRRH